MIYLLHGNNTHLKKVSLNKIRNKYKDYTYTLIDFADSGDIAKLDQAISQISLFDIPEKLVHIKNYNLISNQEYLYSILENNINTKNIVIILDLEEKVRSNAKVLSYLKNKENIFAAEVYDRKSLENLINNYLKKEGVEDSQNITRALLDRVDNSPFYLLNEAKKVALLKKYNKEYKNLDDYITLSTNYTIWEYINNLFKGKNFDAIKVIDSIIEKGENEYAIMGMILWALRLIMILVMCPEENSNNIMGKFGYSPYSINNAKSLSGKYSEEKILQLYSKYIELDLKIKSGFIEPRLGIILFSLAF